MKNTIAYRLSLALTVLLTLGAFVTLIAWIGRACSGVLVEFPWIPLGLVVLAAVNCSIRARLILRWRPAAL